MRYITQMSSDPRFRLAIYDLHSQCIIAEFVDVELAETIKDMLNAKVLAG
jgi:hypothetical protein